MRDKNSVQLPEAFPAPLVHCLPDRRPSMCLLNERRDMNATCIHSGYWAQVALQDIVAWLAGASCLGPPGLLPDLASRSQGEADSQSHLPLHTGSHVRSRLSTCLCGKEAGAVSILFHIRHELCPTDMRSHRSNVHPPPLQLLKSRGSGRNV